MIVRLQDFIVKEILPGDLDTVRQWYGDAFAESCMEAPEEVGINWTYDPDTSEFSEPEDIPQPPPPPTTEERLAALEAENKLLKEQVSAQADQAEFYEDCIAEMATVVYA